MVRRILRSLRSLRSASNVKKIPFGIYLSILLGILRKSLLFRKEAKPTKSKRRPLAVFLQKSCFADMVRRQGFEPGTHWLRVSCSTNWANSAYILASRPRRKAGAGKSVWKLVLTLWSGRRDSDPRLSPWQGDTLPLSHSRISMTSTLTNIPLFIEFGNRIVNFF